MDKDVLKKEILSIEDIHDLVAALGGNPMPIRGESFTSQTICHNPVGQGSYKLVYYNNTNLFRCYTECSNQGAFDIYELVRKVKSRETGYEWSLPKAIQYVASYFGYDVLVEDEKQDRLPDWDILSRYTKKKEQEKTKVEMTYYDNSILTYLPQPHIRPWEDEGITYEVCKHCGIKYDPVTEVIVIPHYDEHNNLVGIRQRTLVKEDEIYGKYRPWYSAGRMFNHPLSFNLYGLNWAANNLRHFHHVIVFESEKSVLLYMSYYGCSNNISVAICGNTLSANQVDLLKKYGVEEITIAFDKESDEESKSRWIKKFYDLHNKYGNQFNINFMYDKYGEFLDYKMSPIDAGPKVFEELYRRRINI